MPKLFFKRKKKKAKVSDAIHYLCGHCFKTIDTCSILSIGSISGLVRLC